MAAADATVRDSILGARDLERGQPTSGHHDRSVRVPSPRGSGHRVSAGAPSTQVLVIAKAPLPGLVKTRLCPPCTPEQAARIAAAALADTLDTLTAAPALRRVLVIDGDYCPPAGWLLVRQRGRGLAARLAHAYADTALRGVATFLVGMDTPQLTTDLITAAQAGLETPGVDAVLGLAADGGWWGLGLRDSAHAEVLQTVPVSTPHTGRNVLAALRRRGLAIMRLPILRDVDTALDAWSVATQTRSASRFAAAVRTHVPVPQLVAG